MCSKGFLYLALSLPKDFKTCRNHSQRELTKMVQTTYGFIFYRKILRSPKEMVSVGSSVNIPARQIMVTSAPFREVRPNVHSKGPDLFSTTRQKTSLRRILLG